MSASRNLRKFFENKVVIIGFAVFLALGGFFILSNKGGNNRPQETDFDEGESEIKSEEVSDRIEDTAEQPEESEKDAQEGEVKGEVVPNSTPSEDTTLPRDTNDPGIGSPDQFFEIASFYQSMYEKTPVGTVRELSVNVRAGVGVENFQPLLIDLSNYENDVFAFKWEEGSFEYGLADQREVPQLMQVEVSDVEAGDSNALISDLIPFNGNRYIFIKPLSSIENLSIHLITPKEGSTGSLMADAYHSSGVKYSSLGIIPREVWSGNPDINNPSRLTWNPVYYKVTRFVVHHTVTPNNQDPIYWMKAIYNYHAISCGFGDIGYNYLIDHYGNIYEGKLGGEEAKGYHAGSANANSIGVSVIGTYSNVAPSQAAQDALARLIAEKATFYSFEPGWHSTVYGHRDFMSTACPGNAFYSVLPGITANAQGYKNSHFATLKSVVAEVNFDIDYGDYKEGKLSLIYRSPSDVKVPAWSGIESYTIKENILTLLVTSASTPYEGVNDRLRTLYKAFWMRGDARYVGLIHKGRILEVSD